MLSGPQMFRLEVRTGVLTEIVFRECLFVCAVIAPFSIVL